MLRSRRPTNEADYDGTHRGKGAEVSTFQEAPRRLPSYPAVSLEERQRALAALDGQIAGCRACPLAATRTRAVPGEGPVNAELMFVGEAPGFYEDQQGRPFVGPAGQFLDQLLASIGLKRGDVFIANIIKSRPPGNRDPFPAEIEACGRWLTEQLAIIQPRVVVTLGRYAQARFMPGLPIGRVHGQGRKVGGLWVVPMYHPAAALHQGSLRRVIEDDFKKIPSYLAQARKEQEAAMPAADAPVAAQPAQMKLF